MKKLPTYKHGFKMPEGYLDTFESKLQERLKTDNEYSSQNQEKEEHLIESPTSKKGKVITFQKLLYVGISIAACLAIYVSVQNSETASSMDDIAMTTIEDYLFENTLDFSLDAIAAEIPEDIVDELTLDTNISEEQLEVYLLDHINNNSLILE